MLFIRLLTICIITALQLPLFAEGNKGESLFFLNCEDVNSDTIIANLENDNVTHFIHDFDYTTDYSYSLILNYVDTSLRTDWPAPCIIDNLSNECAKLLISSDELFNDIVTTGLFSDSSKSIVYNLLPNHQYYYKIIDSISGVDLKSGVILTTGQLRMINAGGITNVRDLGGWRSSLGGRLKYGRIFRGGLLDGASEIDLWSLLNVGITSELDLRGKHQSPLVSHAKYNYCSLGNCSDIRDAERNAGAIRILINELLNGEVVYVHCIGGADRTGVFSLLVEGVCGVSESDISKDYELTSFTSQRIRRRDRGGFPEAMDYIKSLPGTTLQEKFSYYLLMGGLTELEINNLIDHLVDFKPIETSVDISTLSSRKEFLSQNTFTLSGIQIKTLPKGKYCIKNRKKFFVNNR